MKEPNTNAKYKQALGEFHRGEARPRASLGCAAAMEECLLDRLLHDFGQCWDLGLGLVTKS